MGLGEVQGEMEFRGMWGGMELNRVGLEGMYEEWRWGRGGGMELNRGGRDGRYEEWSWGAAGLWVCEGRHEDGIGGIWRC